MRPLAVTSAHPPILFSGLPTVAVTVPGYEAVITSGNEAIEAPVPDNAPYLSLGNGYSSGLQYLEQLLARASIDADAKTSIIETLA